MDFHSLLRRDLQFLCKRNKIPANMTNVAMADALKALEIVEGLDEYMNQSDANAPRSPTSVAKQPPNTATRTTRRKTTTKAEPQSSSQLVSRSCRSTSKSLAGEMDQENINKNVAHEPKTNSVKFESNVAKTPAARSTRKASAATSCTSKVQGSKKDELVQSVYSTRRSTRLLEKCMADLSLKTRETVDKPAKNEDTEQKASAQEKNQADSEAEVISGRDLSVSMEQVWENLKNDSNQVVGGDLEVYVDLGDVALLDANTETNKEEIKEVTADEIESDLEVYVDLGDIAVLGANTETNKEKMNEITANVKESENSFVNVDKQEETLQAICEEVTKKNENDHEIDVDLESKNVPALDSSGDQQETEQSIEEDDSEPEKFNNDDNESKKVLALDSLVQVDQQETEEPIQENDSEPDQRINNVDEDNKTDSDAGDSEIDLEEDNSGIDSDDTISEADSNQAVLGSEIADEEMILSESEGSTAAPNSPPLIEEAKVKTTPSSPFAAESISVQFPRPSKTTTPMKNSALKLVNMDKENNMEMMMMNVNKNENGESKGEEAKKKKKVTIAEENLKDVSIRQLTKILKELSIKSSSRPALQKLSGNNQTAE